MPTTIINKKHGSIKDPLEIIKRVATAEKKMIQMRDTLKKHPIPIELLKK